MFSSRRRAKKPLLGVQVCAPWKNGFYYGGVIEAVKSRPTGEITFTIIFDDGFIAEVDEEEVVGPGFKSLGSVPLRCGQPVYISHNGREVAAIVVKNRAEFNEVLVRIPYQQGSVIAVRPDEVSLLKTDLVAGENSTDSQLICPIPCKVKAHGLSTPCEGCTRSQENLTRSEEMAALVLAALSISPMFEKGEEMGFHFPPTPESGSELAHSLSTGSPLPPPPSPVDDFKFHSPPSSVEEGIAMDIPQKETGRRKRKNSTGSSHQVKTLFQCTWPGCGKTLSTVPGIIRHVRTVHLGPKKHDGFSDGEEEFYFNEVDLDLDEWAEMPPTPLVLSPSCPTQTHFDMAKNPWSEPGAVGALGTLDSIQNARFNWDLSETSVPYSKHDAKMSSAAAATRANAQHRKMRGESKKCRKVYGMGNRHLWCTQCRWKKACVRFAEKS